MAEKRKKRLIQVIKWILTAAVLIGGFLFFGSQAKKPQEISYIEFLEMADAGSIKTVEWGAEKEFLIAVGQDGERYKTDNPKYEDFKKDVLERGIEVKEKNGLGKSGEAVWTIIQIGCYILMLYIFYSVMTDGFPGKKKKAEKTQNSETTFRDVAGLEEVKCDLATIVDFLKNPGKYKEAGAEIPKGVLLYGPPGTGKTLLAKAVAGEAGVKFKAVSGSDFEEKFVGVGASRIRKMFEEAKENAPCIIFIDEIDAMGGRRHSGQKGDDRQTLNALLSEMDGFDGSNGIIIMAATNRLDDLDPALTRPGRFDQHFAVTLPETTAERMEVIRLYVGNKKFSDDVSLDNFAKETIGCSPAMIKTVLNEAAIIATRENDGIITRKILDESWMKQMMKGHMKKNGERKNIELVAGHEAGHALAGLLFGQDLTKVSVVPSTSGAGGVTCITPKKLGLFTKKELEEQVTVLYAGRAAEELLFGEDGITTGASNDIQKASELIQQMVTEFGMSGIGVLNAEEAKVKQDDIAAEVKALSGRLYQETKTLLQENMEMLQKIIKELQNKETMTGEEIRALTGLAGE